MNPYTGRPENAFWRTGVAEVCGNNLINIHKPKWSLNKKDTVVTMGSCFAQHIGKKLKSLGFNVPYYDNPDNVKSLAFSANYGNVYTVRQTIQLFEEAFNGFSRSEPYWNVDGGYIDSLRPNVFENNFDSVNELFENRKHHLQACLTALRSLDVFVFTLGLTEAWIVKECGSVLPVAPGVLGGNFDEKKHSFKNFSYVEIAADIRALIGLIHEIRDGKDFRMLLTVSPVPLTATAEPRHVLVSSTYSKAVLRSVAGDIVEEYEYVDYFPSFEIITNPVSISRNYELNRRSVTSIAVDNVMRLFEDAYLEPASSDSAPTSNKGMASLDEFSDADCEDALLDQFGVKNITTQSILSDNSKVLFFGNSHLAHMTNGLEKSLTDDAVFVPFVLFSNNPFVDNGLNTFRSFRFQDEQFQDVDVIDSEVLVIAGCYLFGDGILRSLGPLEIGYEGCAGKDISPSLPLLISEIADIESVFDRQINSRLKLFDSVLESSTFRKIVWVVSPDPPENVARFRLGNDVVDSRVYIDLKRMYESRFSALKTAYEARINFIMHDESLHSETGFVKAGYSGNLPWDIHPQSSFYVDGLISQKIRNAISS